MNRVFHTSTRRALSLAALFAIAVAAWSSKPAPVAAQNAGDDNFVTVDLPASNEVRVENQRGGVEVEVWGEKYLAVAALSNGAPLSPSSESPVSLDRADNLLKITVARAPSTRPQTPARRTRAARVARRGRAAHAIRAAHATAAAPAVNLIVRVPAQARIQVITTGGAVSVRGVPANLDAQTVSGDVRLNIAPTADASISVRTLYGAISVGAGLGADAGRTVRERFATRLGAGTRIIRLSTVRGGIALETGAQVADAPDAQFPAPEGTNRAGESRSPALESRFPTKESRSATGESQFPTGESRSGGRGSRSVDRESRFPANGSRSGASESRSRASESPSPTPESNARAPESSSGGQQSNRLRRPPILVGANDAATTPQRANATPTPPPGTPIEVNDDEVLTVDTSVVTLNFSVVDRKSGRGLTNLIGGDFKIFEDGTEQQITHFEATNAPFDLLLLVDLSGSTAHVTDLIRASARRFVDSVRANDRVGVVAFAAAPQVVSPLTSDKQSLRARIDAMGAPQGDTKLYDAINYSLDYVEANSPKARRRAVVLLTDGMDSSLPNVTGEGSALAYPELRRRVQEFDGLFYAVMTDNYEDPQSPQDVQPETYDLAWDRMEELTKEAGGIYYEAAKLEDVADIYAHVVEDLGTVYSISYLPTNKTRDGKFRAIRVRLPRRPEAVVRGRSGYYAK